MEIIETEIPDVKVVIPKMWHDARGFFMETYRADSFAGIGGETSFVQDNHSRSMKNVLRGLHYQLEHAQGKLVRVTQGEIFDVAVDIRKSSPHFGHWVGARLSAENRQQLWIPPGFAHGFYTLSKWADVIYKTTDYYDAASDRCIRWNDDELGIAWPLKDGLEPILSEKDQKGTLFREAEVYA